MNSNERLIILLICLSTIFMNVVCSSSLKFEFEKILDKNYKSSLEFIFDPHVDYNRNIAENDPIRDNYHKFTETELNMMNGARMKCYTPRKTITSREEDRSKESMKKIKDEYALLFLRDSKNM